ncbi:hypothetical protein XENTR_v10000374 [Xenopus tropicalis]|nr:hypothetical protein XENTR_v10000374 [Xenopus tropicalis]
MGGRYVCSSMGVVIFTQMYPTQSALRETLKAKEEFIIPGVWSPGPEGLTIKSSVTVLLQSVGSKANQPTGRLLPGTVNFRAIIIGLGEPAALTIGVNVKVQRLEGI